jgi:hypothetical protein
MTFQSILEHHRYVQPYVQAHLSCALPERSRRGALSVDGDGRGVLHEGRGLAIDDRSARPIVLAEELIFIGDEPAEVLRVIVHRVPHLTP